ncbi:MAG: DUF4922 domain-containing protein [Bacteroides sp.]|nr:DUF4922 domain-containing protein [Bacteroides sp.]
MEITADTLREFFQRQLREWPLAADHYRQLQNVRNRTFRIGRVTVEVQFNPERIRSSGAKVDAASVSRRPCFLCRENRPAEQHALSFGERYEILVNPYPIFRYHFTLPDRAHLPQQIAGRVGDMLTLAQTLQPFVILYNGPASGASAPDYFHFQAIPGGILPVQTEWKQWVVAERDKEGTATLISCSEFLRTLWVLRASVKEELETLFEELYHTLPIREGESEPAMNLVCWYQAGEWILALFPRSRHRPRHFYRPDGKDMLISPGVVDMAGVLILPREEDFNTITETIIREAYSDVTLKNKDCPWKENR